MSSGRLAEGSADHRRADRSLRGLVSARGLGERARSTDRLTRPWIEDDAKTVAMRLDGDDLDSLAKILRQRKFCELKAQERDGVPDEARPRVEIHYGGLDGTIEMWDGQWHDTENARESLEAVEALAKRVKDRGR